MSDDQPDAHPTGSPTPDETEAASAPQRLVEVVEDDPPVGEEPRGAISEPGKLLRIALMLREMQEEVRSAGTDEAGRGRLRGVHERSLQQLHSVLSGDLREELASLSLPFGEGTPTEGEIRIAQAQLIGWLEGLFQGIQAAIFSQQAQARQQLEQLRPRGIGPGQHRPGGPGGGSPPEDTRRSPGQYL